ncbi:MAG: F0F1 ATP synthase subunit B [Actinomycetota bacterium]|nr:F0F1 ATP synthase subunit B [Actinomycetota bacterium]
MAVVSPQRCRSVGAGLFVAAMVILGSGTVAIAQEAPAPEPAPTNVKQTEVSKCVEEAVKTGSQAEECLKAPNPILPAANELIWGSLTFLVLFVLLAKKGYPAIKKGLDARADKIRGSLDEAERTKQEAMTILEDYKAQLADAKNEAARIIDEARQAADKLRQDLKRQAEAEVADIKARAQDDIAAQVERAKSDLQERVSTLSIELAEKVVEKNLDRDTNLALVESFIRQTGTGASSN